MAEASFNNFNDLIRGGNIIEAGLALGKIRDKDLKLRWIHDVYDEDSFLPTDSMDAKLLKLVQASIRPQSDWLVCLNYLLIEGNVTRPEKLYRLVLDELLPQQLLHTLVCFIQVNRSNLGLLLSCAVEVYVSRGWIIKEDQVSTSLRLFLSAFRLHTQLSCFEGLIRKETLDYVSWSPHAKDVAEAFEDMGMLDCLVDEANFDDRLPSLSRNPVLFDYMLSQLSIHWTAKMLLWLVRFLSATMKLSSIAVAVCLNVYYGLNKSTPLLLSLIFGYASLAPLVLEVFGAHNWFTALGFIICFHAAHGLFLMNASLPQGYFWAEFSLQSTILVVDATQKIDIPFPFPCSALSSVNHWIMKQLEPCYQLLFVLSRWVKTIVRQLTPANPIDVKKQNKRVLIYLLLTFLRLSCTIAINIVVVVFIIIDITTRD